MECPTIFWYCIVIPRAVIRSTDVHIFLRTESLHLKESPLFFLGPHYDNPDSISPEFTPTSNVCEVQRLDSDHLPGICVWRSGRVRCNQFPWQLRSKKARETKEQIKEYWYGTWGERHDTFTKMEWFFFFYEIEETLITWAHGRQGPKRQVGYVIYVWRTTLNRIYIILLCK